VCCAVCVATVCCKLLQQCVCAMSNCYRVDFQDFVFQTQTQTQTPPNPASAWNVPAAQNGVLQCVLQCVVVCCSSVL